MAYKDPEKQKEYNKAYLKVWYQKNKQKQMDLNKKWQNEQRQWLQEYKKTLSCSECPESDPRCLDFHHKDPSTKTTTVSRGSNTWNWSKKRILKEIEKCVVLCANCHRKKHFGNRWLTIKPGPVF